MSQLLSVGECLMSLGQFGKQFLTSLEENRPEEYRLLERSGQLQAQAVE